VATIIIFTDDSGWHGRQLQHAFSQRGYDSQTVSLTECQIQLQANKLPLFIPHCEKQLPAAAFVRGVAGGSLEEVVLYLDILHALKLLGIPVYNNANAIERSVDKGMTSFLLYQAGLPTPLTWVLRNRQHALAIAKEELQNGQFIISKPLFGSQGEGVRRLEKMSDLLWLSSSRGVYYLQRFIACAGDYFCDYRVFVINNKAVAAMRRKGKSWLNNVAQGASCERVEISNNLAELAIKATQALSMDYAGVDIIEDKQGQYIIIEVNSIPAWKGLESVCDISLASLLADDLINRHIKGNQHVC
jgi:RimK family alpha-L-glutamate ligase